MEGLNRENGGIRRKAREILDVALLVWDNADELAILLEN
jgi:hypothetical protein